MKAPIATEPRFALMPYPTPLIHGVLETLPTHLIVSLLVVIAPLLLATIKQS
jgi:hypothetical protein